MSSKAILILEDQEQIRAHHKRLLEEAGYTVFEAENGQEGLEQLKKNTPIFCIILDYQMPIMNGMQFLETVKLTESTQDIPVVMCTSCSDTDPAFEWPRHQGWIRHFLPKPFTLSQLQAGLALVS